jgi:hypothetical protein
MFMLDLALLAATVTLIASLVAHRLDIAAGAFVVALGLSLTVKVWRFLNGTLELPLIVRTRDLKDPR